jgi:hypothetical protein
MVNKLISLAVTGLLGLVVLTAAGPILIRLMNALVPLVIVVGLVTALLQAILYFTRRW